MSCLSYDPNGHREMKMTWSEYRGRIVYDCSGVHVYSYKTRIASIYKDGRVNFNKDYYRYSRTTMKYCKPLLKQLLSSSEYPGTGTYEYFDSLKALKVI